MTYLQLNSFFLVPILFLYFAKFRTSRLCFDRVPVLVLMVMTAIFDNFIVAFGIVSYDESKLSGIKILYAPVEDFAYTLVLVPLNVLIRSYYNQFVSKRQSK
jgi:lycopene cyclase domain-containing protein